MATPVVWRAESQVNTTDAAVGAGGTAGQFDGQVVGLLDGGYLVVWTDQSRAFNTAGSAIVGQRYSAQGARVGGEFRISQFDNTGNQLSPAVTLLSNGFVAVAFVDFFTSDHDIFVRIYDTALNLVRTDSIDVGASRTFDPSITASAGAGYAVSYTAGPVDDQDIVARIVSAGGTVGAQFDVDNHTDNRNFSQLATLSNGNFVAVYVNAAGPETDVSYDIFTPTGNDALQGAGIPGGINVPSDTHPDVAALTGGGFVAVWANLPIDADGEGIRATIRDNAGFLVRSNFQVNTSTAGIQDEANVVALADGGFLVTWEDEAVNAVRAQRFDATGDPVGFQFALRIGNSADDSPEAARLLDGRIAYVMGDVSTGDPDVVTSIRDPRDVAPLGDVLWRHIGGAAATANSDIGSASTTFDIRGTGDFDGDGDSDILWRHTDGLTVTWELQNGTYRMNHNLGVAPTTFQIRGTGDFDGDGDSDILWRHVGGANVTWEMQDGEFVAHHNLPSAPTTYQVAGTGDFDADGDADILWRHAEGGVVIWEMEGGALMTTRNLPSAPTTYQIRGTGDFDADGDADIIWRHRDGGVVTWEIEDGALMTTHNLPHVATTYQIVGTRDFTSDGDADILWRHNEGQIVTWDMEDGAFVLHRTFGEVTNDWQIRGTGQFDLV